MQQTSSTQWHGIHSYCAVQLNLYVQPFSLLTIKYIGSFIKSGTSEYRDTVSRRLKPA